MEQTRTYARRSLSGIITASAVAGAAALLAAPAALPVVAAPAPAVFPTFAPAAPHAADVGGAAAAAAAQGAVAAARRGPVAGAAAVEVPEVEVPAVVSAARPARVVSTVLDAAGRPVISVRTATTRASAQRAVRESRAVPRTVAVELDATAHLSDVPAGTDPYRARQWDFTTLGVAAAWQRSTGAGTVVAVIDSGVDASHPDLAGQVLPGIDLVAGTTGTSTDPNGHGTHVAGTIAATTGNGVGISAVAPDARILPVRAMAANGEGDMSAVASGIVWAADHGADVINMSLGSPSRLTAVTQAIAYARSKGVAVVAAAGNEGQKGSPTSYPAADAGVIAVAATDADDAVAPYSTRGSFVDVAAPGSDILSTWPTGSGYAWSDGTSMAAPHVAAVAALLKAANPALTPDAIEQALTSTAVDLGPAGRDTAYGWGRIDPVAALSAATPSAPAPTTIPPTTPTAAPTTAAPTAAPTTSPTTAPVVAPSPSAPTTPPASAAPIVVPSPSGPATPAPRATKPPVPGITVSTGARDVAYGTRVTTRWTVTAGGSPLAGAPAQICTSVAGAAFTCRTSATSAYGTVTVTVTATANRRVRLLLPATATTAAASSPISSYVVRPRVTVARAAARKLSVKLDGAAGQRLRVQRLTGTAWRQVAAYPAARSRTVTGLVAGARYRVVVPATASLATVTSKTVAV